MKFLQIIVLVIVLPLWIAVTVMQFLAARRDPQFRWLYGRAVGSLLFVLVFFAIGVRIDLITGDRIAILIGAALTLQFVSGWIGVRQSRRRNNK